MAAASSLDEPVLTFGVQVELSIVANGDDLTNTVRSYIARELRGLNDVQVVEKAEPRPGIVAYAYHIIVIEEKTKGGDTIGYSLAAGLCGIRNMAFVVKNLFRGTELPQDRRDMLEEFYHRVETYETMYLHTGGEDQLRRLCGDVVTEFDTGHLQDDRKSFQRFQDFQAKRKGVQKQ